MGCASGGCSDWDYTVSVCLMEPTGNLDSTAVLEYILTLPTILW